MKEKIFENLFFIIAGICLIICSTLALTKLFYYKHTIAVCIDINDKWFFTNDSANKGYKSTYKFEYEGQAIIANEKNYLGRKNKLYKKYIIFFNPQEPTAILTVPQIVAYVAFLLFGAIILLISLW